MEVYIKMAIKGIAKITKKRALTSTVQLLFLFSLPLISFNSCQVIKNKNQAQLYQSGYLSSIFPVIELLICNREDCNPKPFATLVANSTCTEEVFTNDNDDNHNRKLYTTAALKLYNGTEAGDVVQFVGNISKQQLCIHAQSLVRPVVYLDRCPEDNLQPNIEAVQGAIYESTQCEDFSNNTGIHQNVMIKLGDKCELFNDISLQTACEIAKLRRLPHVYWGQQGCEEGDAKPEIITPEKSCSLEAENKVPSSASIEVNGGCIKFSSILRNEACENAKRIEIF